MSIERHKEFSTLQFVARIPLALKVSAAGAVIAIIAIMALGMNYGLEFSGGTIAEIRIENTTTAEVKAVLDAQLEDVQISQFGSNDRWLLRFPISADGSVNSEKVLQTLQGGAFNDPEILRFDVIGPQFGAELKDTGGISLLVALILILVYIAFRFVMAFGIAAVGALLHDVFLAVGLIALLQLEIDMTVLSALLAIIGYSLNDTIVICDRIREHFKLFPGKPAGNVINDALNATLGRTVITGLTTLLALLALLFFSGETLRSFSILMIFGVIVGTYSSIFIVPAIVLKLSVDADTFKEVEQDDIVDDGIDYMRSD